MKSGSSIRFAVFNIEFTPVIALMLLICGGCRNGIENVNPSKQIGESIVTSLKEYRAENRNWPASLDSLVPGYMKEIRPPTYGTKEWSYFVLDDGNHFELSFEGATAFSSVYIWHSKLDHWHEDSR